MFFSEIISSWLLPCVVVAVFSIVLIVAHRLSTIRQATQIVVLDNHQIVDVGSHDVLLERCSKYQDLIKRQSVMHQGKVDAPDLQKLLQQEDDLVATTTPSTAEEAL
jgi:hypothetical protein